MYAIIQATGRQYKVSEGETLMMEKVEGDAGAKVDFDHVLLVGEGDGKPEIGAPVVKGATVTVEILRQARDKKVIAFKRKRRKGFRKKIGHRQPLTEVKILKIQR